MDTRNISRIHLDVIGGVAGDMFVAAMTDAFPEHVEPLMALLRGLNFEEEFSVDLESVCDGDVMGRRFSVRLGQPARAALRVDHHHHHDHHDSHHREHSQHHHHDHDHQHGHHHRSYRDIRRWLDSAVLDADVREHAHALFRILAEAEGTVHGVAPDDVGFHEVGAVDSIIDFVAAAYLIHALQPLRWSWSPLPLGGGRIDTAHGVLPVPAPATTLLLRGLPVVDDGVQGERVTPTGAAIIKYLSQLNGPAPQQDLPETIEGTGFGFGSRRLPGLPNVIRCLVFASCQEPVIQDTISTLHFEIDDQTAEDLAVVLDRIRDTAGVLEVFQAPLFGKKGRMTTQVQILTETPSLDTVVRTCLEETTTLGLRIAQVSRRKLRRRGVTVADPPIRAKVAERPSGRMTAKVEMDELAKEPGGFDGRDNRRQRAEHEAILAVTDEADE